MKSITVTTVRSINFGAVLQAYALHRVQRTIGVDNFLLDTPALKNLFDFRGFTISRHGAVVLAQNLSYLLHLKKVEVMLSRFNSFIEKNIQLTQSYKQFSELCMNPPEADFYINGSDQVFGLRGELDRIRMMRFLPEKATRFSYAASLGEYDWNEREKREFASILKTFSQISVREQYSKDYLESFADVRCQVNIDPVFLLTREEWQCVAKTPNLGFPYILCYPLLGNKDTQNVINQLKAQTGYKVVCVQTLPIKRVKADHYIFDAGPAEFLGLIQNAEAVVTTSFHGTAFSAIFEKPFYTLIKDYKSQRITELLSRLGLYERIYHPNAAVTMNVDFKQARDTIFAEKRKSLSYLRQLIALCVGKGDLK